MLDHCCYSQSVMLAVLCRGVPAFLDPQEGCVNVVVGLRVLQPCRSPQRSLQNTKRPGILAEPSGVAPRKQSG